jgi:predicted aspartyl protease
MQASLLRCLIYVLPFIYFEALSAQTQVSFEYHQSLIFVKAKINGSRTNYLFLLNTGANRTVIDKSIADLLKLPVKKDKDSVIGTAGKEAVGMCRLRSIQVGDAMEKNIVVTCRALKNIILVNGRKVDGILGTDFLRKFSLTIDYNKQKLTFDGKKPVNRVSIPFEMNDGIPRFVVKLDDTLATGLHYNSGVSMEPSRYTYVNISRRQFNDLKDINPYIRHSSYIAGRGVGGDINLQVLKIGMMELNGYDIRHPYLILQPEEGYFKQEDAVGFFGNNLLEKYQSVTLDFQGKKLYFNKLVPRKTIKVKRGLALK